MEKRADRRGVSPLLVFAAVLLAGVLVAGVALAWQVWGTTALAARAAEREAAELRASWASPSPAPPPSPDLSASPAPPVVDPPAHGQAAWLLRIPALGGEWPVIALDDLGAEFATAYSQSVLYQVINDRMTEGRATIISTNLDLPALSKAYNERILSRLIGSYTMLGFVGRDIRQQKLARRREGNA